ncbi:MAG: hypothetical protein AABO41_22565 [Acidobacteriota bacterium]
MKTNLRRILTTVTLCSFILLCLTRANAQTTEFTYQGRLSEGGNPATGSYDFEFLLYDALAGGSPQGVPVQRLNVAVASGIFTVQLDFGNQFNGANRFLDISVKAAGGGLFTPLTPRQQVTSNPYAIKSLNSSTADGLSAACANCVTSSQIQSVPGSKVTGSISGSQITGEVPVASIPPGSNHYIRNSGALQAADIYISGDMAANAFDSNFGYSINGDTVLTAPGLDNYFVGYAAGAANHNGRRQLILRAHGGFRQHDWQQQFAHRQEL